MYEFGEISNSIMSIINFVRIVLQFWMYTCKHTQNQPYMPLFCAHYTKNVWWWSAFFSEQNWVTYQYVSSWRSLNDHRTELDFLTLNSGRWILFFHVPCVKQFRLWIQHAIIHRLNGATVLSVWSVMT